MSSESSNVIAFTPRPKPGVLEFFAGVGLARMGLERAGFEVVWANDYEPDKYEMYAQNYGDHEPFEVGDVGAVVAGELPPDAALAWASSPCTDLSLAGNRQGLAGRESSAFYKFTDVLGEMDEKHRPGVVVLENVTGLATSHGGDDLAAAVRTFNLLGYSVDAMALDARRFLPQSRPRLFLVGARNPPADHPEAGSELRPEYLQSLFANKDLITHRAKLREEPPSFKMDGLTRLIQKRRVDPALWWDDMRLQAFRNSLSTIQKTRVDSLMASRTVSYRTAYRRTRGGVPMWEVRPDDIAGCLRTARGGSSKQAVVKLGGSGKDKIQVRWMTGREYAELMGAPHYNLDGLRDSQVQYAFGDAVAVDVVAWLGQHYLMPLVRGELSSTASESAASQEPLFDCQLL